MSEKDDGGPARHPMTDIREKVARAICQATYDRDVPIGTRCECTNVNDACQFELSLADAALSASGYREMREALEDLVQYMTARSEFEIGGDDDSHAAYASGVVHNARRILNPDAPFEPNVRAWTADDWARAKETQRMGRELLSRLYPKEGT